MLKVLQSYEGGIIDKERVIMKRRKMEGMEDDNNDDNDEKEEVDRWRAGGLRRMTTDSNN